ncbi:MAG: hypothetical protein CSA75_00985 [Sorangium cellulosum]|nr:MAG: hypothetical protein CSA75_00985 [Sorangium cellulosum]
MQTEKKIYIGLVVLVIIGGLIYMQLQKSKEDIAAHAQTATSASLPQVKLDETKAEKVSKLVVKNKDKDEVILEKRGDKWWVTKPLVAIASQQNVKSTIDNLKAIETKDAINDTAEAPAMYKDYELEGDKSVHVTAYAGDKGDEKVFDAFFGKSGSRGQMARLNDKPGIWVVKGYSGMQYTRQVKDWREKSVLKFEDKNVASMSIKNKEGEYSFSKNGEEWSATFNQRKINKFSADKVKDMLRAFRNLNAENFADDKKDKPEETGLGKKPVAVITIVLKDEAGTHTLSFGKTSSGSSRYVKKNGDDTVYILGSWASDWAVAKVDKFQKSDDDKKGKPAAGGPPGGMPAMPPPPPPKD